MNLLVLGASGGVGGWLTQLASERGHHVTALVRASAPMDEAPGVRVIRGDPFDAAVLATAVAGRALPLSIVRRANVAAWMLEALARPAPFSERAILLGTR
jgi:putative NADH-flavin reductase